MESRIHTGASELLEADVAHAAEKGGDDEIVENNQGILKVTDDLFLGAPGVSALAIIHST